MIIKKINIEVVGQFVDSYKSAAASTILPLHSDDWEINSQGLADYLDFLHNAESLIQDKGLEVIKNYFSNNDRSFSYYLSAFDKGNSTQDDMKVIFFFRISDHDLGYAEYNKQKQFYENESRHLKQPPYKRYQRFKVRSVIVDDTNFDSYDDALDYLGEMIDQMKDRY